MALDGIKDCFLKNSHQMEHIETRDGSRASSEDIAPFLQISKVDNTFIAVSQLLSTTLPNTSVGVISKYFLEASIISNAPFTATFMANFLWFS